MRLGAKIVLFSRNTTLTNQLIANKGKMTRSTHVQK